MHRFWSTLPFFATLLFDGCHHPRSYAPEFLKTDGFRYRAGSATIGSALDTLRIAVVAVNESREPRGILLSSSSAPFNRVAASVERSGRKWDSDTWRPAKQPATYDPSDRPILSGGPMMLMGISPGTSRTFVLAVPVMEVLGDSLPRGRYRVTARVRINGHLEQGLDAGDVVLSPPPV